MKILHVIRSLNPSDGGPPNVAASLAAAQAADGHSVAILGSATGEDPTSVMQSLEDIPGLSTVRLLRLAPRGDGGVGGPPPPDVVPRAELGKLIASFDVLHIHAIWDPILISAGRLARRAHVPYIITPHGMLDRWSLKQRRFKKTVALALYVRRHLNGAAGLHALNAPEEQGIQRLRLKNRIQKIPNGVFLQHINPAANEPEVPRIVFLSRLHFKKGLDFLAEAFHLVSQEIPEAELVVVGPDHGARNAFELHIKELNLSDRVRIVGPVFGTDKLTYIRDATCFCLPSRQEGFSVAILEALACARPVVISKACNFAEVGEAEAGFVVPLDPEIIADRLLILLGDRAQALRMGGNGRALVEARFTWEAISRQMVQFYERCRVNR